MSQPVFVDMPPELANRIVSKLCHIPPKPWVNTMIYGDTAVHITVAGSR
jgi:hypothetical protein